MMLRVKCLIIIQLESYLSELEKFGLSKIQPVTKEKTTQFEKDLPVSRSLSVCAGELKLKRRSQGGIWHCGSAQSYSHHVVKSYHGPY